MIRNGLFYDIASKPEFSKYVKGLYPPRHLSGAYPLIIKTKTRRLSRGIYQVEAERKKPHKIGYAVQPKRGMPAEPGIRIVMDRIWKEEAEEFIDECEVVISQESAWAEGGYTPTQFEELFANLNPEWLGWSRWAFKFHVVAIRKEVSGITSHAREERVKKTFYPLLRGMC